MINDLNGQLPQGGCPYCNSCSLARQIIAPEPCPPPQSCVSICQNQQNQAAELQKQIQRLQPISTKLILLMQRKVQLQHSISQAVQQVRMAEQKILVVGELRQLGQDRLNQQRQANIQLVAQSQKELGGINQKIEILFKQIQKQQGEVQALRRQIKEGEEQADWHHSQQSNLYSCYQAICGVIAELKSRISNVQHQVLKVSALTVKRQLKVAEIDRQNECCHQQVLALNKLNRIKMDQLNSLSKLEQKLTLESQRKKNSLTQAEKLLTHLRKESAIRTESLSLRQATATLVQERADFQGLQKQRGFAIRKNQHCEMQIDESRQQIALLKAQLEKNSALIFSQRQELAQASREIKKLDCEVRKVLQRIDHGRWREVQSKIRLKRNRLVASTNKVLRHVEQ